MIGIAQMAALEQDRHIERSAWRSLVVLLLYKIRVYYRQADNETFEIHAGSPNEKVLRFPAQLF
jgi:hypothetical protein